MNALFPNAPTTTHRVKCFLLLRDPSPLNTETLGALCSLLQRVILYSFSAGPLSVVLLAVSLCVPLGSVIGIAWTLVVPVAAVNNWSLDLEKSFTSITILSQSKTSKQANHSSSGLA